MSWVLAFLGFAALIILHEAGHFGAAKAVGMRVERFALFFPPLIGRVRRGETEYAIGSIPLGGYVRITGMNPHEELSPDVAPRAYFNQPVWKRIVVIAAGPAVNIVLALVLLTVVYAVWGPVTGVSDRVESVSKGMPASGRILAGDRIVAVDGKRGDAEALRAQVATHTCAGQPTQGCRATTPALVTVERNGTDRQLSIRPVYVPSAKRVLLGYAYAEQRRDVGVPEAVTLSAEGMWRFTKGTVEIIAGIFQADKREQISGVVGSYESTRQAIQLSTETALTFLALISLSLGVINLFPFLPLDGGHIFWAVAEKVRGRAIPFSVMERAGFIGFALVLALFMVGLTNDIGRLTGEGITVR
jgi:regulator of sigma E protease